MNAIAKQSTTSGLIDTTGAPLRSSKSAAAYSASDRLSQELASFNPGLLSADAAYLPERDSIAGRVQHVVDNNGWASGAMQRFVDQAIGANFRFSWRPDWQSLGIDQQWVKENQSRVERKFRAYGNDPRRYVDAAEHNNLSGLLGLGFRSRLTAGETLGLAHWTPRPDFEFATTIQIIDVDRLSNPHGAPDSDRLRGGVERNRFGAAQAYHIRASHPGDTMVNAGDNYRWERVARRTRWGRSRVLHHFEQERAGQTRGKSLLTPVLEKLKMEDRWSKVEMQAALVNAVMAAFIESPFDQTMLADSMSDDAGLSNYQAGRVEFHNQSKMNLDGMRIPTLYPGEKFSMPTASRPNAAFAEFERTALRYVAAAIGQSYEQLAQDWSSTNYSSARAALLESWKFLTARRDSFADGFATPIFVLWLEEAFDNGTIELPNGAPRFWDNPAAWSRGRWIGPGRGWVDPTKEAQASQMRMDSGLSTLRDECAEQGLDYEEVLNQRAIELAMMTDLKLPRPGWADGPIMGSDQDDLDRKENATTQHINDYADRMEALQQRL